MNATTVSRQPAPAASTTTGHRRNPADQAVIAQVVRRERRARDYGVGYGNSSGYASGKRYADNWGNALFQCR